MIDIHAHILPGLDDGAKDMYDTLELLNMAAASGVESIVATPHCNIPEYCENYYGQWYIDILQKVQKAAKWEGIPIKVYPGMEVYATDNLDELLKEGRVITINRGKYMLVEFAFDEDPDFTFDILRRVKELKVCPIIAHPERYYFVQDDPQIIYEWRKQGYQVQVNKGSFQGRYGESARFTAYQLMDHHLVSVISSDAHSPKKRTTYMKEIYHELERDYSSEELNVLFQENPRRILENKPTLKLPFIPFTERKFL